MLLLATTVVLRGVRRLQEVNPGFNPASVFQARISIPSRYQSPNDISRFYDRLSERFATLPVVQSGGVISVAPLSGLLRTVPFTIEGEARHERDLPSVNLRIISTDYLRAINTHTRTRTQPATFRSTFVASLRAIEPDAAAIAGTGAMRDYIEAALGPRRFNLSLFASFSVTGVLLSGLYGLVAYAVSQRLREIGLRIAIGATEADIRRLILRQAALLGLAGTALGGCLTAAARPVLSRLAQDGSIPILPAMATAGLLLVLVMLSAWPPARRAAQVDPTAALRHDKGLRTSLVVGALPKGTGASTCCLSKSAAFRKLA